MSSELLNKSIPIFSIIWITSTIPKIITYCAWFKQIQWHFITLAFSWCMGKCIVLTNCLVMNFCVSSWLCKWSFVKRTIIACSDLSFLFKFSLIWLRSPILCNLSWEWTSSSLSVWYSIRYQKSTIFSSFIF